MNKKYKGIFTTALLLTAAVAGSSYAAPVNIPPYLISAAATFQPLPDTVHYPEEKHFKNIQQLTFGGDNAEAYWSYDSKYY